MKSLLLMSLLFMATQSQAQTNLHLRCFPSNQKACANAYAMNDKCIDFIEIDVFTGVETINYRAENIGTEVKFVADVYPISTWFSKGILTFADETGDQNGTLKGKNNDHYTGSITVDQDFEYQVRCTAH